MIYNKTINILKKYFLYIIGIYEVKVTDDCIGCVRVYVFCEEVFEMVDGKSKPKVSKTDDGFVKEAQEACPVDAIKIE